MIRTKFMKPITPSKTEAEFIYRLESTHDHFGISEQTLKFYLKVGARTLRTYKEKYNNFKYLGITPKGIIRKIDGLYRLVRKNDSNYDWTRKRLYYDKLCGILADRNAQRIYGTYYGQLTLFEIEQLSDNELIELMENYAHELVEGKK